MASYDRGYGPTVAQFLEYTNRQVVNTAEGIAEFERQRARAQEVFDAVCGRWPKPQERHQRILQLTNVTSTTFTASNLNSDKDDMYNHMELRAVQGPGSGFSGYISDYDGTTKTATVATITGDFSLATTATDLITTDIAVFPRAIDLDVDARPRYPESLVGIISYILEYWVTLDEKQGFNVDIIANNQADVVQEGIGDWQTTYRDNRSSTRTLIGSKAYDLAVRYDLIRRTGQLRRYGAGIFV